MPEKSLEQKLREELEDLHRYAARTEGQDRDPLEFEQRCGMLEMGWLDRINEIEIEAVRNIKPNMEALLAAQDLQIQVEENQKVSAIQGREPQFAYWMNHREGELTPSPEAIEAAREQIQERYSNLREGMQEAVRTIGEGKEPDLSFLIEQQLDKEQAKTAIDAEATIKAERRHAALAQMNSFDRECELEQDRAY